MNLLFNPSGYCAGIDPADPAYAPCYSVRTRFIGYLSLALDYQFHGLKVLGYHVFNLTVHIVNALLVYLIVLLTFKTPFLQNAKLTMYSEQIALFSSLCFVSHPVQTQAVTYIVQRFASLATLFYLLSLMFYVKARLRTNQGTSSASTWLLYLFSLFSAALAMETKEIAFTLPVIVLIYEFYFFDGNTKMKLFRVLPILLTTLIIPLVLAISYAPLPDMSLGAITRVQTDISRSEYLFTEFRVMMTYIRLIFFPVNQNLDYDYPIYHSFFLPEVLISFVSLSVIFGAALYLWHRSRASNGGMRLISFGIVWFFVTLAVESSFIPIADVIYEHRIYLPSVGAFIAVVGAIFAVMEMIRDRTRVAEKIVTVMLVTVVIVLMAAAHERNNVWQNEVRLWEDTVSKSPQKARAHVNLGNAYYRSGLLENAEREYRMALSVNPYLGEAAYNLSVVSSIKKALESVNK